MAETVDESEGRRVVTTTAVVVAATQGGEIFRPLRESDAGNECLHCEHAEYRYIAGDKYDGNSGIDDDDDDSYGDYVDDANDDDGDGDGDSDSDSDGDSDSNGDGEDGGGSDGGTSYNDDDDDGHIVHGDRRVARDSDRLDRVLRETRPRLGLRLR